MELKHFISLIYYTIAFGTKSLYEFTIDFFDNSTYDFLEDLTLDKVKGWFRKVRNTHTYRRILNADSFSSIRFSTWLKSRTLGSWKKLQAVFCEVQNSNYDMLINHTTDNHDLFIESVENQFKVILGIPVHVDIQDIEAIPSTQNGIMDYKTNSLLSEQNEYVLYDIDELLKLYECNDIEIIEIKVKYKKRYMK